MMYTEDGLQSYLWKQKLQGKSLRAIAEEFGVNHAVIQRGLNGEFPRDIGTRLRLGIPVLRSVPVCHQCGEVHVRKRCSRSQVPGSRYRSLWDWPVEELRRALVGREEFSRKDAKEEIGG